MSDAEKPQTSSASVNAQGDTNIGGDVVGRDKIETHQYYQQAPSEDQDWQLFYAGGWLARTLLILGTIILVVGVLAFFGGILLGSGGEASGLIILGGFGAILVGGIMTGIGRAIASHGLYRQRSSSRRQ